jgi:DivIVA domain-containing protein
MELTPQTIRSTSFRTARKGYDTGEVDAFKERAAAAIETAQNQAAAMEARARAAVARLQELSSTGEVAAAPTTPAVADVSPSPADADTISRTLLLAQRTADATVADARAEADRVLAVAQADSAATIDNARLMAGRLLEEARVEARRSVEEERMQAENEVQALMARRDFLLADVEQLEQYVGSQRERLRDAAVQLLDMVDRVPGGFGDMRRPLLSASGDGGGPDRPGVTASLPFDDADGGRTDEMPAAETPLSPSLPSIADDDTDEHPAPGGAGSGDDEPQ